MNYFGKVYRPPSEADALILQATIGCSWNHCVYCDMYSDKPVFRIRPVEELLTEIEQASRSYGRQVEKVFLADGDALVMDMSHWTRLLPAINSAFPHLRRISCYATAINIEGKTDAELVALQSMGLSLLYLGPESGDDRTLKQIAKGSTAQQHVVAAQRAKAANMAISAIFLLGAGGKIRSEEHARASGQLATQMDPDYLAALTLTVIPGTTLHQRQQRGRFSLPDQRSLLRELRIFIENAHPTDALFRTNHASNYLPLAGRIPKDRDRLLTVIDAALAGDIPLRPEWGLGL